MSRSQSPCLPCVSIPLLIALIVFIVYYSALHNEFLTWDDASYVTENTNISSLNGQSILWMFTQAYAANWHPLTWLSHALDIAVFGMSAWGHHLTSVIIHCGNVIWFFILSVTLILITNNRDAVKIFSSNELNTKILLAAGIAALLFGIHPQNVESVAWIAERKNVLCLFFMLPALLAYLLYSISALKQKAIFWYLLSLGSFTLALLSKPMAISLPMILILLDIYPLKRIDFSNFRLATHKSIILDKIPFFLLSLASGIITLLAQQHSGAVAGLNEMGIDIRLLNAANSITMYLSQWIFPILLLPFYDFPQHMSFIPVFFLLLVTILCIYAAWNKVYYPLITWALYLLTLAPMLGVIQVGQQAAADRYAYLPMLPFYLLLGVGIANLDYSSLLKKGLIILFLSIMVIFTFLTQQQIQVWKNDISLWQHVLKYNPHSFIAYTHLGHAFVNQEDYTQAIALYRKSIELKPDYLRSYYHLANTYLLIDKPQLALSAYQHIASQQTDNVEGIDKVYFNMALIYFKQGDRVKAQEFTQKTLKANPQHEKAKLLSSHLAAQPTSKP